MTEKELERLEKLSTVYERSQIICNPLDFAQRQQILLEAIAEHLLDPYWEHLKDEVKDCEVNK